MNPENEHTSTTSNAEQVAIAQNEILMNENMDQDRVDAIMNQFGEQATKAAVRTVDSEISPVGNEILSELTADTEENDDALKAAALRNQQLHDLHERAASQDWPQDRIDAAEAALTKQ